MTGKTQQGHKSHQIQAEGVIAPFSRVQQLTFLKTIKEYECWGKLEGRWNTTMLMLTLSVWWPDRIRQKSCSRLIKACRIQKKSALYLCTERKKNRAAMTKPSISIVNESICIDPLRDKMRDTRHKNASYTTKPLFRRLNSEQEKRGQWIHKGSNGKEQG